ncbi:hypothetical protein ACFE04_007242 [Oxalis oulophora]
MATTTTEAAAETSAAGKSTNVEKVVTANSDMKSGVDALWGQMNKGVSTQTLLSIVNHNNNNNKPTSAINPPPKHDWMVWLGLEPNKKVVKQNDSEEDVKNMTADDGGVKTRETTGNNWASYLGLAPNKTESVGGELKGSSSEVKKDTSDEAKKHAAAALAAVKDAAAVAAVAASRGKVEITQKRDFAGQEVEFKRFVDADSKEAKPSASSAVDAVLDQIRKKPKLSVLDKTKKDWGEFKDEHRGVEDELDAYKKSSSQYLDRVSFLQRTEYREFERERDARLSSQSKRKPDSMREDL